MLQENGVGGSGQASLAFGEKKQTGADGVSQSVSQSVRCRQGRKKGLQLAMQQAKYRGWVGHARDEFTDEVMA